MAWVGCIHSGVADSLKQDVVMRDNALRTTLAAATNASQRLPFPQLLEELCPDFVSASEAVRQAAAVTGEAYAQAMSDSEGDGKGAQRP